LPPIIYLDASKRFPLVDGCINYVYNEHMIEHIPYEVAVAMVKECFRVLKPGGRIRIATPDLDVHTALANGPLDPSASRYVEWMNHSSPFAYRNRIGFVVNRMFYDWGHCFIYDQQMLTDLLKRVGFVGVERHAVGLSADPEFAGLEMHGENVPPEINKFQTMVLEAAKPPAASDR
jgi:SAM-dependent methyltransferase